MCRRAILAYFDGTEVLTMANERRLIMLDYDAVRKAFDKEFKETMQLIKNGETHLDNLAEGFTEADRVLREMPTVDAVEVVRCKDCEWFAPNNDGSWVGCQMYNAIRIVPEDAPGPDDYCSYGEHKSGTQPQREDV